MTNTEYIRNEYDLTFADRTFTRPSEAAENAAANAALYLAMKEPGIMYPVEITPEVTRQAGELLREAMPELDEVV